MLFTFAVNVVRNISNFSVTHARGNDTEFCVNKMLLRHKTMAWQINIVMKICSHAQLFHCSSRCFEYQCKSPWLRAGRYNSALVESHGRQSVMYGNEFSTLMWHSAVQKQIYLSRTEKKMLQINQALLSFIQMSDRNEAIETAEVIRKFVQNKTEEKNYIS